jgi:arylsulfatase A-like enzyme
MLKKVLLILAILAAVSLTSYAAWKYFHTSKFPIAEGYNIVLLSIDTTRADFFGCYGNSIASTPAVDELASKGVLFEDFYSTINTTLAAHSSMMTGLYPPHHGVGRNSMRLNGSNTTLAEFLQSNGYTTAAFIGSFALASVFNFNQGFQTFDESFIGSPSDYIERQVQVSTREKKKFDVIVPKESVGHISRSADQVNNAFFQWLSRNKNKKFFAFIHYYDPHFPYLPEEAWYKKHLAAIPAGTPLTQDDRAPLENTFKEIIDPEYKFRAAEIGKTPYPNPVDALLKLYLSEIEYADHAVGEVIRKLEMEGLRSKTIFILTADHGENLVEHWEFNSFFRHGFLTHESETHIPFIISAPGFLPQGKRVKQIASQVDILPTIADLFGYRNKPETDGISLLQDLFAERRHSDRAIYMEASQPQIKLQRDAPQMGWVNERNSGSIRWGEYKYTSIPIRQYEAVFHIAKDRTEENDILLPISKSQPKLLIALRDGLEDWRKKIMSGKFDATFKLSEEDQEKLKSLGYVQ